MMTWHESVATVQFLVIGFDLEAYRRRRRMETEPGTMLRLITDSDNYANLIRRRRRTAIYLDIAVYQSLNV